MQHGGAHLADRVDQVVDVARVGDDRHRPARDERRAQRHVAVHVEHGHHQGDDIVPIGQRRAPVGVELHRRHQQRVVRAERRLGRAGGAAAEQENRRVVECQRNGRPGCSRMLAHQVAPPQIARLQVNAVALLFLLGQRKQQAQCAGRYSLMFVAITRRTCVRACSDLTLS